MKRWLMVVIAVLWVAALAACGGGDDGGNGKNGGDAQTTPAISDQGADPSGESTPAMPGSVTRVPPTNTPRPPAPRSLPAPEGDPVTFETPLSAGAFLRQRVSGSPVSTQTGGQQATYTRDGGTLVLRVYHFPTAQEAMRTVEFTLSASSIAEVLGEPHYAAAASFGVARDQHDGYLAAWSRNEWAFIARTSGDRAVLDDFLSVYPY